MDRFGGLAGLLDHKDRMNEFGDFTAVNVSYDVLDGGVYDVVTVYFDGRLRFDNLGFGPDADVFSSIKTDLDSSTGMDWSYLSSNLVSEFDLGDREAWGVRALLEEEESCLIFEESISGYERGVLESVFGYDVLSSGYVCFDDFDELRDRTVNY